eukprot:TRINITY_DN18360_c0_g1_i1.p1 TRINITY_DN18360_c0_g1~~TRINITY_DN18360_c0_g1_i1.p1  ORF type:complete len:298 (+),score=82.88 TRINITY_DN18360_c0_g1_i1:28-894(+)
MVRFALLLLLAFASFAAAAKLLAGITFPDSATAYNSLVLAIDAETGTARVVANNTDIPFAGTATSDGVYHEVAAPSGLMMLSYNLTDGSVRRLPLQMKDVAGLVADPDTGAIYAGWLGTMKVGFSVCQVQTTGECTEVANVADAVGYIGSAYAYNAINKQYIHLLDIKNQEESQYVFADLANGNVAGMVPVPDIMDTIAYDNVGKRLLTADSAVLWEIDQTTGNKTQVCALPAGIPESGGLAIDNDGIAYIALQKSEKAMLAAVNIKTCKLLYNVNMPGPLYYLSVVN